MNRVFGFLPSILGWIVFAVLHLVVGSVETNAQQPSVTATPPLVFDGVTVIDVVHGTRLAGRRVIIAGNRIKAIGIPSKVAIPRGARVVNAAGKYLIPGLWDMHTHSDRGTAFVYPLFLANGVTGIRDAGSTVPLDTLRLWRQEIQAGMRVGPPRQILSGQSITGPYPRCRRNKNQMQTCIADSADARHYVDSLKAAGADMIKPRDVSRAMYFVIAAEARRMHMPFGGHTEDETAIEASDSGASVLDHMETGGDIDARCLWDTAPASFRAMQEATQSSVHPLMLRTYRASVKECQPVATRFQHNNTWWVPTMIINDIGYQLALCSEPIIERLRNHVTEDWTSHSNWLRDGARTSCRDSAAGILQIAQRVGLPILAGTDMTGDDGCNVMCPGFVLHAELAMYVAEGLTPLKALQAATLNPAKMLHATDSLGTVAVGKLADLVLLDADPLIDITNTTTICAVVANGRYFDRSALDRLFAEVRAMNK